MIDGPGALELADSAVSDALARLQAMGDVEIIHDKLTAGGVALNDSTTLVDAIKAQHGFGCTISAMFGSPPRLSPPAKASERSVLLPTKW